MTGDQIYCMYCKHKTGTKDEKIVETVNGRKMIKGICVECGTKKNQFVTSEGGKLKKTIKKGGRTIIKEKPKAIKKIFDY